MSNRLILVSACVLHIVLATALALTHLPLCDEGFYGVPAHVLSTTGALRNPVLEQAGVKVLSGIDRQFYWMAPMGMVLQAGAFKALGFGLLVQRELSALCGLGVVLLWYLALRRLLTERIAALAALALSADFVFLSLSSLGRSDMISLFFGMAGIAAYLNLREQSLNMAAGAAAAACGLGGIVHPNGAIVAGISLVLLAWHLDRARVRSNHLAIAAAAFAIPLVGWGLYIAKAPELFAAQFLGSFKNRYAGGMSVVGLIASEKTRYLSAYGPARLLLPLSYFASLLFCVLSKDLRRRAGILLLMFAAISLSLDFLDGARQGWYVVYRSPLFCAFLALSASRLWESRKMLARIAVAAQVLIVLLGVASHAIGVYHRNLQRSYEPAVAYLNAHVGPQDLVFAGSAFYYGLRCRHCLRDDQNLGAFSKRHAQFIVLDRDYDANLAHLRERNPAMYRGVEEHLRRDYREVLRTTDYRVLREFRGQATKSLNSPFTTAP